MNQYVALVTGASRGLGRAIALEFGRQGYAVAVNYAVNDEASRRVVDEIVAAGGTACAFKCDVTDAAAVKGMVAGVAERFGRIDVLVNNAAVIRDRSILKMSAEEWQAVLDTDLTGPFAVLKECARVMMRQRAGSVVNIASIVGVRGSVGGANYAAAKAGLIGLSKSAAREFGRFGICVNAVLPGYHLTDMGRDAGADYEARVKDESVLGVTTDRAELARFVVFLAGMRTVSGQVFNIDSRII